jgi:hypothetical protein
MIFFGGLFMVAVSFLVFVMFANLVNDKNSWLEDFCAATMMMGVGIAIIGVLTWIGKFL